MVSLQSTHSVVRYFTNTAPEPGSVLDHVAIEAVFIAVHTFTNVATSLLLLVSLAVRSAARLRIEVVVAQTAIVPGTSLDDHQPPCNPAGPHPWRWARFAVNVLRWSCFCRNKDGRCYNNLLFWLSILHKIWLFKVKLIQQPCTRLWKYAFKFKMRWIPGLPKISSWILLIFNLSSKYKYIIINIYTFFLFLIFLPFCLKMWHGWWVDHQQFRNFLSGGINNYKIM